MADYKKIAEEVLRKAKLKKTVQSKSRLNEAVVYPDGMNERMHPDLETELAEQKHSLGKHPIFPEGDEDSFEQKIMGKRFKEVATRYKRAFDLEKIDNQQVISEMMPILNDTIKMESSHKKELEKLAISMIREEYDMSEDVVEINAELVNKISLIGTKKSPKPLTTDLDFDNHGEMVNANKEVYKRRFLNAMIQGASKKSSHMFHLVDDELSEMEGRLPSKYAKLMAAADYMYYIIPKMENGVAGGVVKVQFPSKDNPKAVIHVQALVFPVLIHELVKGVMELLSGHGLPKDKKIGEFVINKADFLEAESWDMRIGPALWDRFTNAIDSEDFNLKHHIYSEIAALPVDEFNTKMREIMANTTEGKQIISDLVLEIKKDLDEDEFNDAMTEIYSNDEEINDEETNETEDISSDTFNFEDLMGGPNENEGFDLDELM